MRYATGIGLLLLLFSIGAMPTPAQQSASHQRPPIIDMHIHAAPFDRFGNPPPPNPVTGKVPRYRTNKTLMDATLREMKRYNIVKAVASGPLDEVQRWKNAAPNIIIGGLHTSFDYTLPDVATVRKEFLVGRFAVLGELGLQYVGMSFDDPRMEPYYALAEELDIPVALHTGTGPSARVPEDWRPLGNPASLKKVLIRDPKLRVYL
ncbi:MAG TPA: amidohydrolase family protein [Pyrinomonadaceae bacterium]|nr:amidohydrolase family protein [Pyrinomonadaceae bacterium]